MFIITFILLTPQIDEALSTKELLNLFYVYFKSFNHLK